MGIPCNCNYHDPDIGWVINYIKQFRDEQENDFKDALDHYMQEFLQGSFVNAVYDSGKESILLTIEQKSGDGGYLYYDAGDEIIKQEGKENE